MGEFPLPNSHQPETGGFRLNRRAFLGALGSGVVVHSSQARTEDPRPESFSSSDVVSGGHRFFGSISRGLAEAVESAASRWGQPNAYILGQEGSAAFIGGLRYGEGKIFTRNAGDRKVYWQGPSVGFDAGADGARTMMLIYNLPKIRAIYRRFGGMDGSAYLIGGFGVTALASDDIVVAPMRSGLGARLGLNVSYLKFTDQATWNPF